MKLPIFGALAYLVLTLSPFRAAAHQPEPAYPAGDFMLQTAQGDSLQLSSLRGRVVLLNFWTTWCKPCLEEMPDLSKLHEKYSPNGLTVVGLAADGDMKAKIDELVERLDVTYPVVYGSYEVTKSLVRDIDEHLSPTMRNRLDLIRESSPAIRPTGGLVFPTSLLIDREGNIAKAYVGTVPIGWMRRKAKSLLRK